MNKIFLLFLLCHLFVRPLIANETEQYVLKSVSGLSIEKERLENEECLNEIDQIYRQNKEQIIRKFNDAIANHKNNKNWYSPVHVSILAVKYWSIHTAINDLLAIIDYEIDITTVPLGCYIMMNDLYPAADALVELEVEKEKIIHSIIKSKSQKNIILLSWIMHKRFNEKTNEAVIFLEKEKDNYKTSIQKIKNINDSIKILKETRNSSEILLRIKKID